MNIAIEQIPQYKIAYMRQVGPYGAGNAKIMEKLKSWARSNNLFNDKSIILGIAHDDPDKTEPENCRYDVCLVVSGGNPPDSGDVDLESIAGGSYAVFKIIHTAEAVQQAWIEIFTEISKRGYEFDAARPVLERYMAEMVNNHFCEICVPIKQ